MRGRTLDSDDDNVFGEATYEWLPGGFFLVQRIQLNFMGMDIQSTELIGHDPETGAFASSVYSNLSGLPLPYKWDLQGDVLKISVQYGPLDASFEGQFSSDGESFAGGWRPTPGKEGPANVPYDIGGYRVK